MKTANEMILEVQAIFYGLKAGEVKLKDAAEMHNSVGKMIGLTKLQLEYAALRKEAPDLPFLADKSKSA
jgi:hypothetical protein